jgi:hypothetical protein
MGAGQEYTLMYDLPAVYGLYLKSRDVQDQLRKGWIERLKTQRKEALIEAGLYADNLSLITSITRGYIPTDVRYIRWGVASNDNGDIGRGFGDIRVACDPEDERYNKIVCDYKGNGAASNRYIGFSEYYCEPNDLKRGACFDPCMSMRYPQGFWPGGKLLNLIGYDPNSRIIRLVNDTRFSDIGNTYSILQEAEGRTRKYRFRGPANTPYSQLTTWTNSIDPCKGGGNDHCNYNTATIELGGSAYLVGDTNVYNQLRFSLAQLFLN